MNFNKNLNYWDLSSLGSSSYTDKKYDGMKNIFTGTNTFNSTVYGNDIQALTATTVTLTPAITATLAVIIAAIAVTAVTRLTGNRIK